MLFSRSKEEFIEEIEQLPDEAWAGQDRMESDERLAEMAGISDTENVGWSDEELLGAGWTQEQIDIYRAEQENMNTQEAEILSIMEEE